jgi:hypothetical protein
VLTHATPCWNLANTTEWRKLDKVIYCGYLYMKYPE